MWVRVVSKGLGGLGGWCGGVVSASHMYRTASAGVVSLCVYPYIRYLFVSLMCIGRSVDVRIEGHL
jgi:hypothetical protein